MLRPICKITFTKESGQQYIFDYCNDIEIRSSAKDLTSKAKITLPRKFSFRGKVISGNGESIFNRGDQVKIQLGYYPDLKQVYEGYVTTISSALPIVLECEDKMFLLKKTKVKYTSKEAKLADLLKNILPASIQYKALDVNVGSFRISNKSVCDVLDKLRQSYGFSSYFRKDGLLSVGFPYDSTFTSTQSFHFEKTIIDDSDLKFQKEEDVIIQIRAISIQRDNSKIEYTAGDLSGSVITKHTTNSDLASLKKFAESKLKEVKYTGYTGMFETFGEPIIYPGDVAKLDSNKLPERNGSYSVDGVIRRFGMGGYRQFIQPGPKV
jgi:hypothetical protein